MIYENTEIHFVLQRHFIYTETRHILETEAETHMIYTQTHRILETETETHILYTQTHIVY